MCRVPIFLSKETIKEKRWPSYRGRRAGQQVNNREIVRRRCISTIERPRRVYCWSSQSHGTQRNISNCKYITPNTPGSKLAFVPSFLLSNVMSLAPKMDELRVPICNANVCFSSITETWLKEHIEDTFVSIPGYNTIRGVCMYVRDSIRFRVLHDFMSDEFEVLWMQTLPKRFPRGISSIIVGTVYHPPSACDSSMRNYLCESMSSL